MNSSSDCLRAAFQALLRGDLQERDRLCARAEQLMAAEQKLDAMERVMSVDFYVTLGGVVIATKRMAAAARAIQ